MATAHLLDRRDPDFIAEHIGTLAILVERYHSFDARGLDRLPRGRALLVGNHNGGVMAPDMLALAFALWRKFGPAMSAYALANDNIFANPAIGSIAARLGAVPAKPEHALALLEREAKVLVYPGGEVDAYRPSAWRDRIVFGRRVGFVRLALRARAPIVPVVSAGAHDVFHVFNDGRRLSERTGITIGRFKTLPIVAGLPWGIWTGPLPFLPLPVHMGLRVLEPIGWPDAPPGAADDDAFVGRCRDVVLARMQAALDEMLREGAYGRRLPAWLRRRRAEAPTT